jgi:phosphoribosylformylglycinamidine synthase
MNSVRSLPKAAGFVLGICNGFQILCEAGSCPGALIRNRDLHFICDHIYVRVETSDSPFTNEIQAGQCFDSDRARRRQLRLRRSHAGRTETEDRIVFRYCDPTGAITDAANPNGSRDNIAGICNRERNVLGLNAAPERACEDLSDRAMDVTSSGRSQQHRAPQFD